jgi:hypothetical protein
MHQQPWRLNFRDATLTATLLALVLTCFFANPETIPAGGGFGYDGVIYAQMVSEIDTMISRGELSEYYAKRVLPSLVIRQGLIATGLPFDANNIINGFRILNFLLLVFCVPFWMAIAQQVRVSTLGFWTGILGLVLIFPNSRQLFYYPVLTDTFAFTVGTAMVWAYITRRIYLITLLSLLGTFAWPLTAFIGISLLVLTLLSFGTTNLEVAERISRRISIGLLFVLLPFLIAIGSLHLNGFNLQQCLFGRTYPFDPFLRLFINLPNLILAGSFVAYLSTLSIFTRWIPELDTIKAVTVAALLIAIVIIPKIIINLISNPSISAPGMYSYIDIIKGLLITRVRDDLAFLPLVSHVVYYGPVFLLLLTLWRPVAATTVKLGPGFVFTLTVFSVLSIFAESRFTSMLWPFTVTLVSKTISEINVPKSAILTFVLCAAWFSKLWLNINQGPWPKPDLAHLFEWPKSVFFSSQGPWMTSSHYVLQGMIVALSLLIISVTLRRTNHTPPLF